MPGFSNRRERKQRRAFGIYYFSKVTSSRNIDKLQVVKCQTICSWLCTVSMDLMLCLLLVLIFCNLSYKSYRLKLGNACYYSVQNLFIFQFAIQNLKIKIYRIIILPVLLYGCETWSLTLRDERRLRVFENRVLRRVFGPKRDEVTG